MSDVFTIDLTGRVKKRATKSASIEFVQAQMLEGKRSPFALITYKENGIMPRYGLRLDLHKRSFLDHFDDKDVDLNTQEAAIEITEVIGQQINS